MKFVLRYSRLHAAAFIFVSFLVASATAQQTYLVWISVDGFRHDYVDRAQTPTLDRLVREGASTRALAPGFPTLTFPSHVSQATGTKAEKHGILSNSFIDRTRGQSYSFPPFANLLQTEPIWNTAQRQGVRTAVRDWPLSHRQRGPYRTDYHNMWYDGRLSDQDRLDDLINVWREDEEEQPLRFLMGYGDALDKAGHQYGPDAPEIAKEVAALDERLGNFVEELLAIYRERAAPEDSLYLFVTTDHGMSPVHTAVNVDLLTGLGGRDKVQTLTAGNLAQVYLHDVANPITRWRIRRAVMKRARAYDFVRVYTQKTLPQEWGFRHKGRGGDIVLVLAPGHVFNRRAREVAVPAEEANAVLGAHGYDVAEDPHQHGFAVFWRYPQPLGGHDLGPVESLRLHATAAKVLGIEPSPQAEQPIIDLWSAGQIP